MSQQDEIGNGVLASGKTIEVREFVRKTFSELGIEIDFTGKEINKKGVMKSIDKELISKELKKIGVEEIESIVSYTNSLVGKYVIEVNPKYFRPVEVDILIEDATKAREKLEWKPKHKLEDLIKKMVESDLEKTYKELVLKRCGFEVPKNYEL